MGTGVFRTTEVPLFKVQGYVRHAAGIAILALVAGIVIANSGDDAPATHQQQCPVVQEGR